MCTSLNKCVFISDVSESPRVWEPSALFSRELKNYLAPSLISRDFSSNFSCSLFFFLLASCFLFLDFEASPNRILVTLSCGAGRREIRKFVGGRV